MGIGRRRLGFVVVAVIALAAALGWYLLQAPREVAVARVTSGPAIELVYATGFIEAERPVTVSSRITAPVIAVLVEEGDRVARGQPLVRLDASEQRALLAQAEAEERARSLAEQRITTLYRQGWVTKAAYDEAVAAGESARAALAAMRARLDQLTLRAGIDGIVLRREVEPGDLAMPGRALLELGDPARARVTATVDERDIARIRPGQRALLSTDALPERMIEGRVLDITPAGDPLQRAFRVRIGFDQPIDLPFGLTLEVNIVTEEREQAVLVPASALVGDNVWLVQGDRLVKRPVRVGIVGTEEVEIRAGLAVGDLIVTAPDSELDEGEQVTAR